MYLTSIQHEGYYGFPQYDPLSQISFMLLEEVLNQEQNAKAYTDFYQQHLQAIQQKTATVSTKPRVFIEPAAGVGSADDACCFTHAHNGWGGLVEATEATDIGSQLLVGATGYINIEKIISMKPDFYVMTGSKRAAKAMR
ncbi:hypothetical protein ED28_12845 [[Pantoea] beijingensis]|uniref:Fe/B12 periplasmic-binding domain-containing protein n=1 Tax=[Pantoea] beijingensis TaxID=1324864 RepID=A0A443IBB0_9GAMM|nr:hypothetical protein ED28_12845 [[Pantoea] beijingensis]